MRAAIHICQTANRNDIRLLTLHPRHILVNDLHHYRFVGFDTAVSDGSVVNGTADFRHVYPDIADFAPELTQGAQADVTCDIYALGVLLKRLLYQQPLPLPVGEQSPYRDANMWDEWRSDPLECFAFHCLARDRNRRFQSLEQCEEFLEICVGNNSRENLSRSEMIDLGGDIEISRFPITNFQFEVFCRERKQLPPTYGLRWDYSTPFAPVIRISFQDVLQYCYWLTQKSEDKKLWRLPNEREWVLATGVMPAAGLKRKVFPWGEAPPTPAHANHAGLFGGPTVVGSHPLGRAVTGCLDLSGNVWEWCADRIPGQPLRKVKGASFASPQTRLDVRSADWRLFGGKYVDVGFRVVTER